jgi:formamidopyrimidine-DNA glycosylase
MPELPEVETLCRQLNEILPGRKILAVEVLDPMLGEPPDLAGRTVEAVNRSGKWLRFQLAGGLTATLHLRMTGRLLWQDPAAPLPAYARLRLTFPAGRLVLLDPRRFATFTVGQGAPPAALAPDPLAGLTPQRLREIARTRRLPVKSFLMDQRLIPGIGNIYACEILYEAGIAPARPAQSLSPAEWRAVSRAVKTVLPRAVACRGTTMSDWRDLYGRPGCNQDHLAVYGRQGKPCPRCGAPVERIVQSGRGTWFCPACQH